MSQVVPQCYSMELAVNIPKKILDIYKCNICAKLPRNPLVCKNKKCQRLYGENCFKKSTSAICIC